MYSVMIILLYKIVIIRGYVDMPCDSSAITGQRPVIAVLAPPHLIDRTSSNIIQIASIVGFTLTYVESSPTPLCSLKGTPLWLTV